MDLVYYELSSSSPEVRHVGYTLIRSSRVLDQPGLQLCLGRVLSQAIHESPCLTCDHFDRGACGWLGRLSDLTFLRHADGTATYVRGGRGTFTLPCSVPAYLSDGAALDVASYRLFQSLLAPQGSRDFIYEAQCREYRDLEILSTRPSGESTGTSRFYLRGPVARVQGPRDFIYEVPS